MERDEAIEEYYQFALRIARRFGRDDEFQSIAAFALVRAFEHTIPPNDNERKAYITTCVRNAILDYLRKPKLVLDGEGILDQLVRTRTKCADGVNYAELLARLQLTDREQSVVDLMIQGYTQQQIAHQVGLAQGTVAKTLQGVADRYARIIQQDRHSS